MARSSIYFNLKTIQQQQQQNTNLCAPIRQISIKISNSFFANIYDKDCADELIFIVRKCREIIGKHRPQQWKLEKCKDNGI